MHNKLKNKMSSFFFQNFSKSSYELIAKTTEKEEVYYKDNKLVVLIEDAEVGKRLYPVIKSLIDWDVRIFTSYFEFQVEGYIADKLNTVQMFFVDFHLNDFSYDWERKSTLIKLQALVAFTYAMEEKGYFLDSCVFNNETCHNISDFLSFFSPNASEVETSNACLIKYIHYILSNGGSLEEYYGDIIKENRLTAIGDFPYQIPIITMCYNYYVSGTIPENINHILQKEKEKCNHLPKNRLLVSNPDFNGQYSITEENEEYTVYDGTIKIFKKPISTELENFLQDDELQFLKNYSYNYDNYERNSLVREVLLGAIHDFNQNIIGYKYRLDVLTNEQPILERKFESQSDIIQFVYFLNKILYTIISRKDEENKVHSEGDNECFNIETDVICSKEKAQPSDMFRILTIRDLKNLMKAEASTIDEQVTMTFFKLLRTYIEGKYGTLSSRRSILSKKEVRYLSPILAKQFANFVVGRPFNLLKAEGALYCFFTYDFRLHDNISCDKRMFYDYSYEHGHFYEIGSFIFQYEVESKYGIRFQKNKTITLPDGRKIVMFSHEKNLLKFFEEIKETKSDIYRKISAIEPEYMKLIDISEFIYSSNLDSTDLYQLAGYISTPVHGIPLTLDLLLSFNNKQIMQVAGKLIAHFNGYFLNKIFIDIDEKEDNFTFYVDILDPYFELSRTKEGNTSSYKMVKCFLEYLENHGYNPNAFIGFNLNKVDRYENPLKLKYSLVDHANSLDTYCDEHKIYYNHDKEMCPVCSKTKCIMEPNFEQRYEKLFEDEYAVHYKYNDSYSLKIYKDTVENIKSLEKNVDTIILMKLRGKDSEMKQDCFIPEKKALSEENQFIGYLYPSVDFNDIGCKSLKEVENFTNLAKIKSLIRLIKQVEVFTLKGYTFDRNPFGDVFLCVNHKKQVQIVNIEFLSKQDPVGFQLEKITQESVNGKWLYRYVRNVVDLDSNIQLDLNIKNKNMLKYLEHLAQDLNMYCSIHNFYYSSENLFCPKCIDTSQMKKFEIEYIKSSEISRWKHPKTGGESTIYFRQDGSVAKVFNEKVDYSFKVLILGAIFRKKEILENINKETNAFKFIIPQKLLIDANTHHILGYIMEKKVEGVAISTLKDTEKVRNTLMYQRKDIFEILITVGEGIQTLHDKANIYIGDLNGGNILIDKKKHVYFLDFDGMGIDNIAPRFSTEGYIDPVSQKTNHITQKDDWYSYAIQAFYYLTYTHPFNGMYEEDGRRLEIPEKMERKLSLLGGHGITPPSIAEPWDWMNTELRNAFLNIFEGESRTNIVPELKKQYHELYGGIQYQQAEVIRINNKFVAKKSYPFDINEYQVVRILNHFSAICAENEEYYVIVLSSGEVHKLHAPNCMQITDIFALKDHAILIYQDRIMAMNYEMGQVFDQSYDKKSDHIVVDHNTLYLSQSNDGEDMIYEIDFYKRTTPKKSKISFLPEQQTVGLLVKFNSKFMLIKRDSNGKDTIYCNSEKLCNIRSSSQNAKYSILYDKTTKLWLVISSDGTVITVKSSNSEYNKSYLSIDGMDKINLQNATVDNGFLYLLGEGVLYIVNLKREMTIKRLECDKLITPDSHLCNFNPNGFNIITNYSLYDISKE